MRIRVLGSSGAELPGHRPPSFLLDGKILFDAGSLTNVLPAKDLLKIEHIFITHTHLDHIMGIPFLADHLMFSEKRHKVNVIGIPAVIGAIQRNLLDGSIWPDFTAIPDTHEAILELKELEPGQTMKIGVYTITPYEVNHPVPAAGYLVEDERGRRFFYTGDTGPTDGTWEEMGEKQIHCLIIDVSFPNDMEQTAIKTGHLTPRLLKEELLKIKLGPKRIYVIHIKSQYLKLVKKELRELGIESLALLKEGDVIRFVEAMVEDCRKGDRRKTFRRHEDKVRHQNFVERDRKLHSLLELGQIIGLDLQLKEMLLQIAQKACEVMEADRGSVFLYDPKTDELWSTVALGMAGEVIRIPSRSGLAGACFQSGKTINLEDVYQDPRFNKAIDAHTGYRTRSLLCMPLYTRAGSILGVIQLLNKKAGVFSDEDEAFLRIFANHVSVFIEIAQLHQARIEALEQSKKELEQLNKAKTKALDHLSHELRTPLAVIQGNIRILKRKTESQSPSLVRAGVFEALEKNLNRLIDIEQETDQIIRSYQELETKPRLSEIDQPPSVSPEKISLLAFTEAVLESVKRLASQRDIEFQIDAEKNLHLLFDPKILEEILVGLLKNAVENTPDEGMIRVIMEQKAQWIQLKIQDFGTGISKENHRHLFDGLFHTLDTDLYSSKKPYDFGAGGKGLDLLRLKTYAHRYGFDISVASQRCLCIPTDSDLCPGKISECPHCKTRNDCLNSGGSTFCLTFSAT